MANGLQKLPEDRQKSGLPNGTPLGTGSLRDSRPGLEIYIPMRVISNGAGSEVLFTLFHLPDMSDEKFAADAEWVKRGLNAVKNLLEA
jgi:hypothetical protein